MYFEDLKLGMAVETEPTVIHKEKMMAFARTYDPIPLHTDEAYAKTTVFGGLIAPGVMSFMSVWAKYLEQDFLAGNYWQENPQRLNGSNRSMAKMCSTGPRPSPALPGAMRKTDLWKLRSWRIIRGTSLC